MYPLPAPERAAFPATARGLPLILREIPSLTEAGDFRRSVIIRRFSPRVFHAAAPRHRRRESSRRSWDLRRDRSMLWQAQKPEMARLLKRLSARMRETRFFLTGISRPTARRQVSPLMTLRLRSLAEMPLKLADTFTTPFYQADLLELETGFYAGMLTIPAAGNYIFGIGVVESGGGDTSALFADNITLGPRAVLIPEPSVGMLLAAALLLFAAASGVRKVRANLKTALRA